MRLARMLPVLPRFLFRADRRLGYFGRAWLFMVVPSLTLAWLIGQIAPAASEPLGEAASFPPAILFLLLVVVGPFLETLILAVMATLLDKAGGPSIAAVGSAFLWAIGHSLAAPLWGLVVWWPFLIMAIAYLVWRPLGQWKAIGLVTAMHGLQNALAGAGLFL